MRRIAAGLAALLWVAGNAYAENRQDVRIIPMQNPAQPFEIAAKLQWNPHDRHWDKVLVTYNGNQAPPVSHPVWAYLDSLEVPKRAAATDGENLYYKPFRLDAYCSGTTPLTSGKPFHITFEQDTPGNYSDKDFFRDWNCPGWKMGLAYVKVVAGNDSRTGNGKALQLKLRKGASGCTEQGDSCINWKPHIGAQLDSLTYSYWFKFPENFDFVLGGKLPGIGSLEPRTGGTKPNGRDGWSVRAMWGKDGKLGQYVYHPDQTDNYGDFLAWDVPPAEKGKWYQVKTSVALNAAGQSNGAITTWLNGKKVLEQRGLRFRIGNDLKIERFLFAVFFGGHGSEWAPPADMHLYLDDFSLMPGSS